MKYLHSKFQDRRSSSAFFEKKKKNILETDIGFRSFQNWIQTKNRQRLCERTNAWEKQSSNKETTTTTECQIVRRQSCWPLGFLLSPFQCDTTAPFSRPTVVLALLSRDGLAFSQSVNTQHLTVAALISSADRCLWVDVHSGGDGLTSKSSVYRVDETQMGMGKTELLRFSSYINEWSH